MMRFGVVVASAVVCNVALFVCGGCVISIGSGNAPPPPSPPHAHGVDICAVDPREYTVTIDEINAVMQLGFDAMRVDHLKSIAARRGLTPAEQEYVACNALHRMGFDAMKVDVLKTLIDNPDFSYRAKGKILRHLNALGFDAMRVDVLRSMEGKGEPPPPTTAEPAPPA